MLHSLRAPEAVVRDAANSRPVQLDIVQAYLTFLQYMPYPNRSCDLCGMMVGEEVDIMHRRTIVSLATTVLILAMAVAVTAQGRGFRGGAIFRAAPPGPAALGPAFIGRPPVPVIAPRIHTAPFGFARSPRTIIVPPVLGYSPYVWPAPPLFAEPGYSPYIGPVYSEPAYASPAASATAVRHREIDLA